MSKPYLEARPCRGTGKNMASKPRRYPKRSMRKRKREEFGKGAKAHDRKRIFIREKRLLSSLAKPRRLPSSGDERRVCRHSLATINISAPPDSPLHICMDLRPTTKTVRHAPAANRCVARLHKFFEKFRDKHWPIPK